MPTMVKKNGSKPGSKLDKLEELAGDLPLYSDEDYETNAGSIPSGSLNLDLAIGVGGHPRGAIIDIFGNESAGKSLISIMAIAELQKQGGTAVVWDAERSYRKNLNWMRINGVDTKKLKFIKLNPKQGAEYGFEAIEKICNAGAADLIVIDSVPALMPQSALNKNMTEVETLGARARMMTSVLPRLTDIVDNSSTCLMFINQMRANIGGGMYSPNEKETGGYALRFFASTRLRVKKVSKSMKIENDVPVGHRVNVLVVKNKVAAPHKQGEFDIYYNSGVDTASEAADILVSGGLVEKKGGWYYYGEEKFQGMANLVSYIKQPKNLSKAMKEAIGLAQKVNAFGVRREDDSSAGAMANEDSLIVGDE
jgi:recombination protein RecA